MVLAMFLLQYEAKVNFMDMLQEKQVNYADDVSMTLSVIKHDSRYLAAGDRARQWLLHFFAYQRQVTNYYINLCQTHRLLSVIEKNLLISASVLVSELFYVLTFHFLRKVERRNM